MNDVPQQGDIGAEKQVLGAVLLSPDQILDVAALLNPEDFYRPAHATIWSAVAAQAQANEPVDAVLIAQRLKANGDLGRIGGAPYLFELVQGCVTTSNATYYADIVARYAGLRRIVTAGVRITQMAGQAAGADLEDLRERSRSLMDSATDTRKKIGGWVHEHIPETLDRLESQPTKLLPTPWAGLDDHIGGWSPGRLYTVGARPGVGKTVVGVQAAVDMAQRHGLACAYVTLEMPADELHLRMISGLARVPYTRLERREMWDSDWDRVAEASGELHNLAVHILDSANVRPMDVWQYARTLARERPLGLVVVDYLQLMSSPDHRRPRHEVVADFSRQLKVMARDLAVPVLACSQLNRAAEGRRDRKPSLSDLRETGAIEQDSDAVILLHRDTTEADQQDMDMIVAKNRHGSTGTVRTKFLGRFQLVSQVSWTPHDVLDTE